MSEKIAVIMAVYNEKKEWVAESIESVLGQTYENIHLYILLDDPENGELKNILKEYQNRENKITYNVNKKNIGAIETRNRLLSFVNEPYVALLDADDIWMPQRLEREMEFLKKHNLDFVMSNCNFLNSKGTLEKGADIPCLIGTDFAEAQMYGNVSLHSTWLLKRQVYVALNGYRNVRFCEDYEFTLRAIQEGYSIGRMSEELLTYRLREGGMSTINAKEVFEKARLLRYLYRKGKKISEISVDDLNNKFSGYSSEQKEKFAAAKVKLDEFAGSLYERKYVSVLSKAVKIMFSGEESRKLFFNLLWGRYKLSIIYKRSKKLNEVV